MSQPLRVLIVEDDERDATLMLHELERGDYEVTYELVDTPEAMSAALERQPWDLVLSDFTMPRFSAPAALSLVKEQSLDIPFIIVSGTIGEEAAVTSLRAGAHDFLVKGRLARLLPAIQRARRDARVRAESRKMQEQLLISERMASVGILAAGIAHEINNPLTILMANLDLASEQLIRLAQREQQEETHCAMLRTGGGEAPSVPAIGPPEVVQRLQDAQEAAERIRIIVRDLKVFSRSDDDERSGPVEIHRVLESSIRMAANEVRHRARLIKDYGDMPLVEGSASKLGQVFTNLIVNAAQAIPEGRAEANEIRIVTRTDAAGRAVVEIHDTGAGIPSDVLPHIFDTFFTTKAADIGTGLGLAICNRIVAAHGGDLSVESQVGRGSMFRTVLPPALAMAAKGPISSAPVPGRRGRILVVDDEQMLGLAIERTLAADHEVTVVASAQEASRLLSGGAKFELILCDLMMPEMTGMDLYAEVLGRIPDQAEKFVFMTGGAFSENAARFLAQRSSPSIEKPFKAAKLRDFVQRRLR